MFCVLEFMVHIFSHGGAKVPGHLPTFFTPKVLRLPAQGCEALGATLGQPDHDFFLPRRGYAHMLICLTRQI